NAARLITTVSSGPRTYGTRYTQTHHGVNGNAASQATRVRNATAGPRSRSTARYSDNEVPKNRLKKTRCVTPPPRPGRRSSAASRRSTAPGRPAGLPSVGEGERLIRSRKAISAGGAPPPARAG